MTYIDEVTQAARGCLAVLRGDRDAPEYFDLTLHGLTGSLIALLVATGVQVHVPMPETDSAAVLSPFGELLFAITVIAMWFGALYGFLRLIGMGERLVPYIVIHNWGSFYASILLIALMLAGFTGLAAPFVVGAVSLYFSLRAAWLVISPRWSSIAVVAGAQLAATVLAVLLLSTLLPAAPQ
jgi:hypothetical protein